MLNRLARVFLALATALVFTGQVEAAASHCARLAAVTEATAVLVKADLPSCHENAADAEPASKTESPAPLSPAKDRCECVAVLMTCASVAMAGASAHIEPYAWMRPEAVAFASVEPAPDLRPPRA
jgi:hypothetical protein